MIKHPQINHSEEKVNIKWCFSKVPQDSNQSMEFHVNYCNNIFGNCMVMHINVYHIDFRYTGVIAL